MAEFDLDHIIQRRAGGSDDPSNLRAAHRACNRKRGARGVPGAYQRPYSVGEDAVTVSVHFSRPFRDLHERVKRRAGQDMRSLNYEVLWLLERALDTLEQHDERVPKQADAS